MNIFISHSSKDLDLVQNFVDFLIRTFKIDETKIFCSTLDGHKVRSGSNWIDAINHVITESKLSFLLISPNYIYSQLCMAELGSVILNKKDNVIPLLLPPLKVDDTNTLIQQLEVENICEPASLERIKDIICDVLEINTPKSDFWIRSLNQFIITIEKNAISLQNNEVEIDNITIHQRGFSDDYIVDAIFSHNENSSNIDLLKQLINELKRNNSKSIDLKYSYLGSISAANWISLSQNPSYGHNKLIELMKNNCDKIISSLRLNNAEKIDYISLGSGDGVIDKYFIHELIKNDNLNTFYPFDISFDLLQKLVSDIVIDKWWKEPIKIKAIQGDFFELVNFKEIFAYDNHKNFFSVLGYTFGNHNEAEFIGKIREGMNTEDYLLLDARLHTFDSIPEKLSNEDKINLIASYNNESTYKFAFGAIEAVTDAVFQKVEFDCIPKKEFTVVPNAINILIECKNINCKFRNDNRSFKKDRISLGSTTLYSYDDLSNWLSYKNFEIVWTYKHNNTGFFLMKKIDKNN